MSKNLCTASHQWTTRPPDERFWGLSDLSEYVREEAERRAKQAVPTEKVTVEVDRDDLCLATPVGKTPLRLTNYSFDQLGQLGKAPVEYLRRLPAQLAATNINFGLLTANAEGTKELCVNYRKDDADPLVRSVTKNQRKNPRVRDESVVKRLLPLIDAGWVVPPARPSFGGDNRARPATKADILPNQDDFGLSVKEGDMIAPAGVYYGDRDMFVFMVNPNRVIDDGGKGLMRGLFVYNSEVLDKPIELQTFYLENVCGNHICWGVSGELSHTGAVGWREALGRYTGADTADERGFIKACRTFELGEDREDATVFLHKHSKYVGLSLKDIRGAFDTAEEYESTAGSPPTTAWGFVHGLTRYSQQSPYAGVRNALDRSGGRILAMAAMGHAY